MKHVKAELETIEILDDDSFWETLNIKSKQQKTQEQQERLGLQQQITRLQAENRQLKQQLSTLTPLQSRLQATELLLQQSQTQQNSSLQLQSQLHSTEVQLQQCTAQLARAEVEQQQAIGRLRQQLQEAVRNNNNADIRAESLREEAARYKAEAEAAQQQVSELQEQVNNLQSKASQHDRERRALLETVQTLLNTNEGLQEELTSACKKATSDRDPKNATPPQWSPARPNNASPTSPPQQPSQRPQQQPAQPFTARKRTTSSPSMAADHKRQKGTGAGGDSGAGNKWQQFWRQQQAKQAQAEAQDTKRRAEEEAWCQRQQQKAAAAQEAAASKAHEHAEAAMQAAAAAKAAQQAAEKAAKAAQRKAAADAKKKAATEAAEQQRRQAEEQERLRREQGQQWQQQQQHQVDVAEAARLMVASLPELSTLSVKELRDFLRQAEVSDKELAGIVEKSDLLQLAESRTQLWECRRLTRCGFLMKQIPSYQLNCAMAIFRIATQAGQTAAGAVKEVKDTLKRTYNKLALAVHPDKAQNGQQVYRTVFEEATKVLNRAYELLQQVAAGQSVSGQNAGPSASSGGATRGAEAGFAGGFPSAGFNSFTAGGARYAQGFYYSSSGFPGGPGFGGAHAGGPWR